MCLFAPLCTSIQAGTVHASWFTSKLRFRRLKSGLLDHFPLTGGLQHSISANDAARFRVQPFFIASTNDVETYGPGKAVLNLIRLRKIIHGCNKVKMRYFCCANWVRALIPAMLRASMARYIAGINSRNICNCNCNKLSCNTETCSIG